MRFLTFDNFKQLAYLGVLLLVIILLVSTIIFLHDFRTNINTVFAVVTANTVYTSVQVNSQLETLGREITIVSKHLKNAIISFHGVSFDIRKNYTANLEFQKNLQSTVFLTTAALTTELAKMLGTINSQMTEVLAGTAKLVNNIDDSLNKKLTPSIIQNMNSTVKNIDKLLITADNSLSENSKELKNSLSSTKNVLDAITEGLCTLNQIAASGVSIAKHYETKILKPKFWDKVKGWFSVFGFMAAEIFVPVWSATHIYR